MAAMIERTATDDLADARRALDDAERLTRDLRAHLDAADRQILPERGTLIQAGQVAARTAATLDTVRARIRDAVHATTYPC